MEESTSESERNFFRRLFVFLFLDDSISLFGSEKIQDVSESNSGQPGADQQGSRQQDDNDGPRAVSPATPDIFQSLCEGDRTNMVEVATTAEQYRQLDSMTTMQNCQEQFEKLDCRTKVTVQDCQVFSDFGGPDLAQAGGILSENQSENFGHRFHSGQGLHSDQRETDLPDSGTFMVGQDLKSRQIFVNGQQVGGIWEIESPPTTAPWPPAGNCPNTPIETSTAQEPARQAAAGSSPCMWQLGGGWSESSDREFSSSDRNFSGEFSGETLSFSMTGPQNFTDKVMQSQSSQSSNFFRPKVLRKKGTQRKFPFLGSIAPSCPMSLGSAAKASARPTTAARTTTAARLTHAREAARNFSAAAPLANVRKDIGPSSPEHIRSTSPVSSTRIWTPGKGLQTAHYTAASPRPALAARSAARKLKKLQKFCLFPNKFQGKFHRNAPDLLLASLHLGRNQSSAESDFFLNESQRFSPKNGSQTAEFLQDQNLDPGGAPQFFPATAVWDGRQTMAPMATIGAESGTMLEGPKDIDQQQWGSSCGLESGPRSTHHTPAGQSQQPREDFGSESDGFSHSRSRLPIDEWQIGVGECMNIYGSESVEICHSDPPSSCDEMPGLGRDFQKTRRINMFYCRKNLGVLPHTTMPESDSPQSSTYNGGNNDEGNCSPDLQEFGEMQSENFSDDSNFSGQGLLGAAAAPEDRTYAKRTTVNHAPAPPPCTGCSTSPGLAGRGGTVGNCMGFFGSFSKKLGWERESLNPRGQFFPLELGKEISDEDIGSSNPNCASSSNKSVCDIKENSLFCTSSFCFFFHPKGRVRNSFSWGANLWNFFAANFFIFFGGPLRERHPPPEESRRSAGEGQRRSAGGARRMGGGGPAPGQGPAEAPRRVLRGLVGGSTSRWGGERVCCRERRLA